MNSDSAFFLRRGHANLLCIVLILVHICIAEASTFWFLWFSMPPSNLILKYVSTMQWTVCPRYIRSSVTTIFHFYRLWTHVQSTVELSKWQIWISSIRSSIKTKNHDISHIINRIILVFGSIAINYSFVFYRGFFSFVSFFAGF